MKQERSNKSNHIKKMEEILPTLSSFSTPIDRSLEYKVEIGNAFGFKLFADKEVGVERTFVQAGTKFPIHIHKGQKQIHIYYQGSGILNIDGKVSEYNVGDCNFIPADAPHYLEAKTDTWMIICTVPLDRKAWNI